jgi:CDP-6-deoxy-D-xylo-4-hexulose-3-dehydrase
VNSINCKKIAKLGIKKLDKILRTFAHYSAYSHYKNITNAKINDYIPTSGKLINEMELFNMIDASLDMWLTTGRFDEAFTEKLAELLKIKYVLTTNSGSSANLIAISALTSYKLNDKKLNCGDEVITTAAGFPTTVAPIIQNNLVPVFVDVDLGTYNINTKELKEAISDKTRAIFIAHTLGNPFNIKKILKITKKYDLWLIEDNCDALCSKYDKKYTGTFGHVSTFSFYPAHHITMGEGGALATNDEDLYKILLSYRDWGRDCWCAPGKDNSCGMRFKKQLGILPYGYDHKYTYSHIGFNLKLTDWQAAIGLSQLNKLPKFVEKRKINFNFLYSRLKEFEEYFILPEKTEDSEPSWFGFPITLKNNVEFELRSLVKFLEENNIGTRKLFSGNILRQPAFVNSEINLRIKNSSIKTSNKLSEDDLKILINTDYIMKNTFWIGIWPGITQEDLEYVADKFKEFIFINQKMESKS